MTPPLEFTFAEFVDFVSGLDEIPPLVPSDYYCDDGTARIKCSGLCCYPMSSGEDCEALVYDDGLMLVSPELWEVLGGKP